MGNGAGQPPPFGAPGQGAGEGAEEQPPPIPIAPDGPNRSYGAQPGSGHAGPGAAGSGHAGAPPAAGGPGAPGAPGGWAGAGYAPYGYGWQGPPLSAGKSIAAMVLGIVSIVLIITCWGSFLSVISSTVALCLGVSARRGVARGELGGQGQATAGFVMGIVGLVLSVIVSVLLVLALTMDVDETDGGTGGGGSGGSSYDARGVSLLVR
ncbi:DUF4190 domain-containing protein [Streptomyces albus]|uniref:DUF4190 domain-containing protein n=1 Tax=Streptomyces albus TaxID=1888 RepID=A0A8H1L8Q4_9ACTN|nr:MULTISPECIES: DUF4190 domain-containing protein [Streptomyces]TGG78041.1 DUF4190 domain-containing protein [Streptomyces albus]UVN54545.1 DUF4190 domain-containing protein [Streptomyces albus]